LAKPEAVIGLKVQQRLLDGRLMLSGKSDLTLHRLRKGIAVVVARK
jgi:hypothetical protein